MDAPYFYLMYLSYQMNSAWGLIDEPGGYIFADWWKWTYKANQARYVPTGGEMFKEQKLWSIFDIGIDDEGWLPGYWRCEYFFFPIWEVQNSIYTAIMDIDWWPWVRDGEPQFKTYVYTIPEDAIDNGGSNLKPNFVLMMVSLFALLLVENPSFSQTDKKRKKN